MGRSSTCLWCPASWPTDCAESGSEAPVRIHDVEVVDESFDDWMSMLDYPAFVVTTQAGGVPAGCLVFFATQTSVEPPRFLVGVAKSSHTFGVASRPQHLAVHVLA